MTENISRRAVAKGAAWSVPVVAAASAVPAVAASFNDSDVWTVTATDASYTGIAGYAAGTVSFWILVTPKDSSVVSCTGSRTVTVNVLRQAPASTTGRWRSMALAQANPNYTSVTQTIDGNQGSTDVQTPGQIDYQWQITFDPSKVYGMSGHRFYVTISTGDGGTPRIYNSLQILQNGATLNSISRF